MSDLVSDINDQFNEYQKELNIRSKKLKLLVDFSDTVDLLSLMEDIRNKEVIFK